MVGSQNLLPSSSFLPPCAGQCLWWRQSCGQLPHHHGNTERSLQTDMHAVHKKHMQPVSTFSMRVLKKLPVNRNTFHGEILFPSSKKGKSAT